MIQEIIGSGPVFGNVLPPPIRLPVALERVAECSGTKISRLDLSIYPSLSYLSCSDNVNLRCMNMGDNPYLAGIRMRRTGVTNHYSDFEIACSRIKVLSLVVCNI